MGRLVYADNVHLHGPLGLARAPTGHLLVTNNDAVPTYTTGTDTTIEGNVTTEASMLGAKS
jgi:hypothetical protein